MLNRYYKEENQNVLLYFVANSAFKKYHQQSRPGSLIERACQLYYIHGPLGDETIFAVLYASLCYRPYT